MADYKKRFKISGVNQPIEYVKYGYKISVDGAALPSAYTFTQNLDASDTAGQVVFTSSYYYRNATITAITYGLTGANASSATATNVTSSTVTQSLTVKAYNVASSATHYNQTAANSRSVRDSELVTWLQAHSGSADYTLSCSDTHFEIQTETDEGQRIGIKLTSDWNATGAVTITITPVSGANFTAASFSCSVANLSLNAPTISVE